MFQLDPKWQPPVLPPAATPPPDDGVMPEKVEIKVEDKSEVKKTGDAAVHGPPGPEPEKSPEEPQNGDIDPAVGVKNSCNLSI